MSAINAAALAAPRGQYSGPHNERGPAMPACVVVTKSAPSVGVYTHTVLIERRAQQGTTLRIDMYVRALRIA